MCPRGDARLVVAAGNAEVIQAFDQRCLGAIDRDAFGHPRLDAGGLVRRERDAATATDPLLDFADRQHAGLVGDRKSIIQMVDAQCDVMHARPRFATDAGMPLRKERQRAFADREDRRALSGTVVDIVALEPKIVTEEARGGVAVTHDQCDISEVFSQSHIVSSPV